MKERKQDMGMDEIVTEFLTRLTLPPENSAQPFILGFVGNIGSGKSTVARKLAQHLPGLVYIQGDSARYLLKQRDMPWAENVKTVIGEVTKRLLASGYAVTFDAFTAEADNRERMQAKAKKLGVPLMFVRVNTDYATCRKRLQEKYDQSWESSFERFRVNTTEKMLANLDERAKVHEDPANQQIEYLVGEIDNNGPISALDDQVGVLARKIRAYFVERL